MINKIYFTAIILTLASSAFAGDKIRGQDLVKQKNCASCHGADFISTVSPEYPKLAGQKEDYLYNSMLSYQSKDIYFGRNNALMQGQMKDIPAKDLKDIASYLSSLKGDLVMKK